MTTTPFGITSEFYRPGSAADAQQLVAEKKRQTAEKLQREDREHQARMAQLAADLKFAQSHRRSGPAPTRLHGHSTAGSHYRGSPQPVSTPPVRPSASTPTSQAAKYIDSLAVYKFRNHNIRPAVAAPAKAQAPRTFRDIASNLYRDNTPSFLVSSGGRGGAA